MKHVCLLLTCFILYSCTTSMGEVHTYQIENGKPVSPIVNSSDLLLVNNPDIIYKTNSVVSQTGDDVFSIYLTQAFMKYLPDMFGKNEVVIIVEFEEVLSGEQNKDTVVKILGPYENIADASRLPFLNKLIYGPKRMESDVLSVKIHAIEYDTEENENTNSLLDFVALASDALSLSNPVTSSEIKVAKEIAKSIIDMNANDLVMQMEFDFVAGHDNYKSQNINTVPLQAGELLLFKQEACALLKCYQFFSKNELSLRNPVGVAADILLAPFTALSRGLTDSPDFNSLDDVDPEEIKLLNGKVSKEDNEQYVGQSFLHFSILKGGDPTGWEVRKTLFNTVEETQNLLKGTPSTSLENLESVINDLQSARKSVEATIQANNNQQNLLLNMPTAYKNTLYLEEGMSQQSFELCFIVPESIEIKGNNNQATSETFNEHQVVARTSPVGFKCYTVFNKDSQGKQKYFDEDNNDQYFTLVYTQNKVVKSILFPIRWVAKNVTPTINICKLDGDENLNKVMIDLTEYTYVKQLLVNGNETVMDKKVEFSLSQNEASFTYEIVTVFGSQKLVTHAIGTPGACQ